MKIAHVCNYAPSLSGMYGTVRDLILAEKKIGVTAEFIDDAMQLKDEYGKDGITPVPVEWGEGADIICWHHAMVQDWFNEPHRNLVLFLHGTPEYNLFTELYEDDRTLSLLIGLANMNIPKAYISMWKRHVPIWENLLQKEVHYIPSWTDVKSWKISRKKIKKDTIRIALMDFWRPSREPFGILQALEHLRKNTDKKIEVDVWGLATEPSKTWKAIFQWMVEDNVMFLKGRSTDVQKDIYDKADMILTMSTEETRVVREATSAGVPVVCGRAGMDFTKYSADSICPDLFAHEIERCHEDLCKNKTKIRKELREYAEANYDVDVSAKDVIEVFEKVIKKNGSVNTPIYSGGRKMVCTIDETANKIRDRILENKPTAYLRNGDGELLFMSGDINQGGMHKNSKKLQKDLIDAFQFKNQNGGYFVASSAGIVNEGRMKRGLFGSFDEAVDSKCRDIADKLRPGEILDNYIALAYKSVFQPSWFVDFLRRCVHGKKVLFIGGELLCRNPLVKMVFDVNTFIPLPMQDAYYSLKGELWKDIKNATRTHDICICAAGMCANVIGHRLWNEGYRIHFLDIGSIADALAGIKSRTWIKMVGDSYIDNYRAAFLPAKSDIIVLTHKQEDKTIECFKSIAKHTSNYRVIWVDNGSGQESINKVSRYAEKLEECDLIKIPTNEGFSKGVNMALRKSISEMKSDWVVLLNNDTVVTHNWLINLISCAVGNDFDAVSPLTSEGNPQSTDAIKNIMNDIPQFSKETIDERNEILSSKYGSGSLQVSGMISFFCAAIKREVIEQVGLLDENLFAYGEDNDYCERLRRMGKKIGISIGTYVHHDHHATANQMGDEWLQRQTNKSKKYLNDKWSAIPSIKSDSNA